MEDFHALINLEGKVKIFSRTVHCQVAQLKEGDEVKLSVFTAEPVPIQAGGERFSITVSTALLSRENRDPCP